MSPTYLSLSTAAAQLGVTVNVLRKAIRLGFVQDHGLVGRSRIILGKDLPVLEKKMREAGLIVDPDARKQGG